MAEEAGQPLHVGDTYLRKLLREVVRPALETGFYSRCWESLAHITEEAVASRRTWRTSPRRAVFLFVAFRIPYSPAVGVKLIATPWTDANVQRGRGITVKRLMQSTGPRHAGVPR